MSRAQQDTIIDDDEETCPLCIEEFDLGDKNFKPCPCGYQICQFCFNSLKNTYDKSTCPNCRRPYDDKTIEYKVPTQEAIKQDLLNRSKKQIAAQKRRENEKKEVEASGRRNLAGVRVKQQNLVYVIGLVPTLKDEQKLLETLRGDNYFGQYGDIEKIVVSKPKPGAVNQGIGVYVTFARKEDAAVCISMVDGSQNGDRVLRAQYGTTKYCSAYLRGENCNNKNCTFLHESGEDGQGTNLQNEPSGKRPNSSTQSSFVYSSTRATGTNPGSQSSRPPAKDDPARKNSTDASALPTTASWAKPEAQQAIRARRESQTASRSSPSPQILNVKPVTAAQTETKRKDTATPPVQAAKPALPTTKSSKSPSSSGRSSPKLPKTKSLYEDVFASVNSPDFRFCFDETCFSEEELAAIYRFPTLIDPFGGAKRRLMRDKEAREHANLEAEAQFKLQATVNSTIDVIEDEQLASGSLQLGGEPEDPLHAQCSDTRAAIGRPSSQMQANNVINDQFSNLSIEGRSLTPHQRQQLALLNSANAHTAPGLVQQNQTGFSGAGFDSSDQRSNLFANQQASYDVSSGHARQSSRYSFASDPAKSTAATRYGQQQSVSAQQQHFYSSGVQGPPPGLKTAGTPPISGGGMFAQGHGFTSNMNTSFGANKGNDTDMFLRGRSGTGSGHDGKHDLAIPSLDPPRSFSQTSRFFPSQASGVDRRSSTPKVPPGFDLPHSHPPPGFVHPLGLSTPQSERSRTPIQPSNLVAPAMPLRPIEQRSPTPSRDTPKTDELHALDLKDNIRIMETLTVAATPNKPGAISTGSPKLKAFKNKQTSQSEEQQEDLVSADEKLEHTRPETKSRVTDLVEAKDKLELTKSTPNTPESFKLTGQKARPQKIDLSGAKPGSPGTTIGEGKSTILDQTSLVSTPQTMSRPETPGNGTMKDPASVPRPRTIRLTTTSTSKPVEAALLSANTEKSSTVPAVEALKVDSRRGSVVSLSASRSSRPASPAVSEVPSSSLNMSRASSPPPSIVGSAPEKLKTKNQLKKERRAKAAKDVLEDGPSITNTPPKGPQPAVAPAEEVGPIVSRQKKKKKEPKEGSVALAGAATSSVVSTVDKMPSTEDTTRSTKQLPSKKHKRAQSKQIDVFQKPEEEVSATKCPPSEPPSAPFEATRPYVPTLRDFLEDLKAHAATIKGQDMPSLMAELLDQFISDAPAMLASMFQNGEIDPSSALFNPPSLGSYRLPQPISTKSSNWRGKDKSPVPLPKSKPSPAYELTFGPQGSFSGQYAPAYPFGTITLTRAEGRALLNKAAVRISDPAQPNDLHRRAMITPRGTVYRHLSAEEEERVLQLESRMDDASLLGLYGPDGVDEDVVAATGVDDYRVGNEYGDFENLRGGVEELMRRPTAHGIVWADTGEGSMKKNRRRKADHHPATQAVMTTAVSPPEDVCNDDGVDGSSEHHSQDDDSDEGNSSASSFGDEESMTSVLPSTGPLLSTSPALVLNRRMSSTAASSSQQGFPAEMNPGGAPVTIARETLGPTDIASLISRINTSKAEMNALKKEVDALEKRVQRRGKDVARWKEGIMGSAPVTAGGRK